MKALQLKVTPPQDAPFVHPLTGSSLVVGRSRTADLSIADRFLSRVHARFLLEGADWFLESLGSHNPTLLNGRPVVERVRVAPGDVLSLGETKVAIEGGSDVEEPAEVAVTQMFRPASEMLESTAGRDIGPEATLARLMSRLKLVNEVHRAFSRCPTQEALLDLILDHAFNHLQPEEGGVFLGPPGEDLKRAATRRLPGASRELLYSRRLARQVTEEGLAALVEDALGDARFATSESIVLSGARSLVAAPLQDGEGCLGMIVLASRSQRHRFTEEDLELLVSLASAAALRIRNFALTEATARHQLLEKELALAHDIQMGMLPKEFPARPEFELAAAVRPAHSVGGDLYEFFVDGERLWFVAGDVSGKGVAAALLMAVTKTLFRAFVQTETSLSAVVARMNRELSRENDRAMFVTAFAGCLRIRTGDLEYSNAGHCVPYRLAVDGSVRAVTDGAGMALGVVEDFAYATGSLRLERGESLFLYTDGVTEARGAGGAEFSDERLRECLGRLGGRTASQVVDGVLAEVQAFAGVGPPHDDLTALAVRFL